MIDIDKYFKFYNSCVPVKGVNRGVIYDLQRGNLYFIPNDVVDLLEEYKSNKLLDIYKDYASSTDLVEKYFSYLIENELIFLTDEPKNFPELDIKFRKPFYLDILFLELDTFQKFKINLINQINVLGCKQIVLITKNVLNFKHLKKMLSLIEDSKVEIVSVVAKHDQNSDQIEQYYKDFPRLRDITFFEAMEENSSNNDLILFSLSTIDEVLNKKISRIGDFVLNQDAYIEAKNNNLFFNRKIYVDNKGMVKHSFNDTVEYGNIGVDSIYKIISTEGFRKLWNITKDQIEECKDCEFRYICPDNRIPYQIEKKLYSHNTKCRYDPKTNLWE